MRALPQNLAQQVALARVREGVYELPVLTLRVRIIVANQLPREEQNAMLHLFSAKEELLRYGQEHYRPRSPETSTVLYQLLKAYSEDADMSDKLKEFARQTIDQLLKELPPEERVKGLSPEERVKGLSAEQLAKALPPETLEALRRQLTTNGSSPKPQ